MAAHDPRYWDPLTDTYRYPPWRRPERVFCLMGLHRFRLTHVVAESDYGALLWWQCCRCGKAHD